MQFCGIPSLPEVSFLSFFLAFAFLAYREAPAPIKYADVILWLWAAARFRLAQYSILCPKPRCTVRNTGPMSQSPRHWRGDLYVLARVYTRMYSRYARTVRSFCALLYLKPWTFLLHLAMVSHRAVLYPAVDSF